MKGCSMSGLSVRKGACVPAAVMVAVGGVCNLWLLSIDGVNGNTLVFNGQTFMETETGSASQNQC